MLASRIEIATEMDWSTKQIFIKSNMLQRPSARGSKTMFSKLFGSKIRAPSLEASSQGAAENGHDDGGKVTTSRH